MSCSCLSPVPPECLSYCRSNVVAVVRQSVTEGGPNGVGREIDALLDNVFTPDGIDLEALPQVLEALQQIGKGQIAERLNQSINALVQLNESFSADGTDFEAVFAASSQLINNRFYNAALRLNQSLITYINDIASPEQVNSLVATSLEQQSLIYDATDRGFEAEQARSLANILTGLGNG